MTNVDLTNLILNDQARIAEAITCGAAWEIWMQIEMCLLFKTVPNLQSAREIPYPSPNQTLVLDFGVKDSLNNFYAVELKVESATNAGTALLANALKDVQKLKAYSVTPHPASLTKWAVVIGYSAAARNALKSVPTKLPAGVIAATYKENTGQSIGVLIMTA